MSRQIKFRGLRLDNKEWAYGYYVKSNENKHWIVQMNCFGELLQDLDSPKEVDPATVGQFVNFLDKNGKEIYGAVGEKGSDIIKSDRHNLLTTIELWADQWMFTVTKPEDSRQGYPMTQDLEEWKANEPVILDRREVIGTMAENPDLLEEQK